ncbi:MAG: NAD(P)/FAD-dependent oxidoreductase [Pseudomonadota bacterium]
MPEPDATIGHSAGAQSGATIDCEALVIGAGPVGLFQVFQLGLQGIHAQVVDALPEAGGQCIELYADKPIYDIPAVQVCTGRELVERLLRQTAPFKPGWHLGQEVSQLQARDDGRFDVATSTGQAFITSTVFIAGGVGAFQPRKLQAPGAEQLGATELFYRLPALPTLAGRRVLVLGGEDGAVQAAVSLADALHTQPAAPGPAAVALLHRRATLTADAGLLARLQAHVQAGRIRFQVGQIVAVDAHAGRLAGVQLVDGEGQAQTLAADALLVQLGISPKLGHIADWGLAMERRQLVVDPAHFETSVPGIYAVGDVVSYPGKKKLILCGFHEATLAAFAALARLRPDEPALLQYTTTSTRLHQRLGVATPAKPAG